MFITMPEGRLLAGSVAALAIAAVALRAGVLSGSGAAAATIAGAVAALAGWKWALLLIIYFVATSALSQAGGAAKAARIGDVVAKGGRRDWRQVAANGGVFVLAAAWWLASRDAAAAALGVGALAAAAADSWATEIGTLAGTHPRSILTFRPVPPGTSGGISATGTAAMVGGAMFVALVARTLEFPVALAAVMVGGVAGALVDSLLGALLQSRRWCPSCERQTEQVVHRCGSPTSHAGGLRWLDNDAVNLACTVAGGLLAMVLAT